MTYDCIIVGGGMAGLQAAIQLGRYQHKVLVIDAGEGRSTWCRCYHNILGWPEGISGETLRETGKAQAETLGVRFKKAAVTESNATEEGFQLKVDEGGRFSAKRILFATGIVDRMPLYSELKDCLGISVFVCPDCDGYEVIGQRTLVLGSGNAGANMALTLTYFTKELVYINHERRKLDEEIVEKLKEQSIQFYNQPVSQVLTDQAKFQGVILENGEQIHASRAFSAFGGNEIRSDLAKSLGVKLHENRHIRNDPRTKMTNVKNVWAAGDVATHSEQAVIAMGEGLQAAIWIHKSLIKR